MSTSQLRSTCMEHRISARSKEFVEMLISRILPYFYIISRENGVKMGYDIYLTMYNREFHTVNA